MKSRGLIIISFIFTTYLIQAQTDFRPGYVIKSDGDTLFGEIDYRGDLTMGLICRFKSNIDKSEKSYNPSEILGYRFKDSKYFISRELSIKSEKKNVFLEFLIKGKICVYYLRDEYGDHYFIDKLGIGMSELPHEEEIVYSNNETYNHKQNNAAYYHKPTKYIGVLKYYMQDAPDFQSRISSLGLPEHENLIRLAKDYHNLVCKDTACIIYEKKLPGIKFAIEPLLGLEFGRTKLSGRRFFEYGANIFLWLPRSNENLYLKSGLIHAVYDSISFYKIPLQMQYLFPLSSFRPTGSIGIDIYSTKNSGETELGYSLDLGFGFIWKLKRNAYISANFNSTFVPITQAIMIQHFELLSFSLSVGLYFEL